MFVKSGKLHRFEQSNFEAKFAILESILRTPNLNFLRIFEKITKFVARTLKRFGHS